MMDEDQATNCDFCRTGHLTWRTEQMRFRQWSDKGYIACRVELPVATCDNCHSKTLGQGSEEIFETAFRREYEKRAK